MVEPEEPQVEVNPRDRRRYTESYKARILQELSEAKEPGAKSALLRREGLYDSTISRWRGEMRRKAQSAQTATPAPKQDTKPAKEKEGSGKPMGRPPKTPEQKQIEALQRENVRLTRALDDANFIIGVQKKLSTILERLQTEPSSGRSGSELWDDFKSD